MGGKNVTSMFDHQQAKAIGLKCQHCPRESYFRVEAVILDKDQCPSGYSGIPCCINCGGLYITLDTPQGISMPCGNCRVLLVLPGDAGHRCGHLACGCTTSEFVNMNGCKQGHGEDVDW